MSPEWCRVTSGTISTINIKLETDGADRRAGGQAGSVVCSALLKQLLMCSVKAVNEMSVKRCWLRLLYTRDDISPSVYLHVLFLYVLNKQMIFFTFFLSSTLIAFASFNSTAFPQTSSCQTDTPTSKYVITWCIHEWKIWTCCRNSDKQTHVGSRQQLECIISKADRHWRGMR